MSFVAVAQQHLCGGHVLRPSSCFVIKISDLTLVGCLPDDQCFTTEENDDIICGKNK